ncbi:MAG: HsdR family type I site-specific deoxyribonuclease [bacterium]
MQTIPSLQEDHISQIPALQLLQNLNYTYLTPQEALQGRQGKTSNVILENILENQLKKINKITFKGKQSDFSDLSIRGAVQALKDVVYDGLVRTNEKVYDLLTLGKSFEQNVDGDVKSFNINFIDWKTFDNNVFHVTEEFEVARTASNSTRRPDLILFLNGIPFVVIECKRPDLSTTDNSLPVDQAVSQHIRNQKEDEIPKLFTYTQLLIATDKNNAKYATTGTKSKFWAVWKEEKNIEEELKTLINKPLSDDKKDKLFKDRFKYVKGFFDELEAQGREVTEQDKVIYSLCQPERLIELAYKFIVFDNNEKKVARYQQYFAVKESLERVKHFDHDGSRLGGVIWHTQGSGKSLTMVMLAKAISLEPSIIDPKIILVTDRVDLDDQIYKTFYQCGKNPVQAASGNHLVELIEQKKESIITVIIDKFVAAVNKKNIKNESSNIFVLVDESHRSQYKTKNTMMKKVFPKGCYIGFTGTPIKKKDKNTTEKFGGIIGKPYKIDDAVADATVVPLLYEGRHALQEVNHKAIDNWFEIVTKYLTDKQKEDLKRKYSSADHLNEADQKIYRIAYDISEHYKTTWQGTGFKGQLTASSKLAAIKYKKYMDEFGLVSTEVLISPPDTREGHEDVQEETEDLVQVFWKKMIEKYGSDENYTKQVINSFKHGETPEIIIVVDKLLTGFDEPKNTVLYIARSLREHTLLQAIARVNRLCEGKDFGYIVDYYGLLGELDTALTAYSSLEAFDEEDVKNSIRNVMDEVNTLSQKHSDLWDIFKTIRNKRDEEEYELLLGNEEIRKNFFERLCEYVKTLEIAMSTFKFVNETPDETIKMYKNDARFFLRLRVSVKKRYAETIDYKDYEKKVQKLIDTYITSDEIIQITEPVNIFDTEKFDAEVEKIGSLASKADTIAHRTSKTITEKWDEDPVFYRKFSEMLKDAIEAFKQKIMQAKNEFERKLSEREYYDVVQNIMNNVRNRSGDDLPEKLRHREVAKAFYGVSLELLDKYNDATFNAKEISADIAVKIDDIILQNKIVDWVNNQDIQNIMFNETEDFLFSIKGRYNLLLSYDDIDNIIEGCLKVARNRYQ